MASGLSASTAIERPPPATAIEKARYFQAMQEKEQSLSAEFRRSRTKLTELTWSLTERERDYRQMMAELQRKEQQLRQSLEDRERRDQQREERAQQERQGERRRMRSRERAAEQEQREAERRGEEERRRAMERELQEQWNACQATVSNLHQQYADALAQQQTQMALAVHQSRDEATASALAYQQAEEAFRQRELAYEQELRRQRCELERLGHNPTPGITEAAAAVPAATQTADDAPNAEGPSAADHDPALFIPKPEYEEDFGPTLEFRMFTRIIGIFVVLVGGAITSRPTMKEMLAAACYRQAVGLPIRSGFLEAAEFPALAACAVEYSTSDPAVMTEVLQECLPGPSLLVQELQSCGRFLDYNFTHFWVLLPLVLSWVAPVALALLVARHDILLLQNRRALIPRWMLALILPWQLTAIVYYVAEPLCNLVLLYRQYADVSGGREVWRNVLPRLFLIFIFWLFLCELFAKLCFSNSSCSLCYLNPLYFTYPKVALSRHNDGLPVLDPQQYENSNPCIVYSMPVTLVATVLYGVMVVLLAWFVVPIAFLELF